GQSVASITQKAPGIRIVIDGGEIAEIIAGEPDRNQWLRLGDFYWQEPGATRGIRNTGTSRVELVEGELKKPLAYPWRHHSAAPRMRSKVLRPLAPLLAPVGPRAWENVARQQRGPAGPRAPARQLSDRTVLADIGAEPASDRDRAGPQAAAPRHLPRARARAAMPYRVRARSRYRGSRAPRQRERAADIAR